MSHARVSPAATKLAADGPGIVDHARAVAHTAGLPISIDLMASTIRIRSDGRHP